MYIFTNLIENNWKFFRHGGWKKRIHMRQRSEVDHTERHLVHEQLLHVFNSSKIQSETFKKQKSNGRNGLALYIEGL